MGFEEVAFVCFVEMDMKGTTDIVQAQAMAALASDPTSSLDIQDRLRLINESDVLVRKILTENKDVLLAAGFREERGDKLFLSDRPFEPGVSIGYRQGHWEQAEPKPEIESSKPEIEKNTTPKRKLIRHKSRRSPSL